MSDYTVPVLTRESGLTFGFYPLDWHLSASYWGNDLLSIFRLHVGPFYLAWER